MYKLYGTGSNNIILHQLFRKAELSFAVSDLSKAIGPIVDLAFICGFLGFVAETIRDINHKLRRKIVQLERIREKLSAVLPDDEDVQNIGWLMLQASAFYGSGVSMQELMAFTGKSRNTFKKKFQAVPVRAVYVPNTRKKFYKIDWKALR